jgi:hypothetical protein
MPSLETIQRNVPTARDAEVLNVMATITGRLGVRLFLIVNSSGGDLITRSSLQPLVDTPSACNHGCSL